MALLKKSISALVSFLPPPLWYFFYFWYMTEIIYKKESYKIIGLCFELHNNLGPGFLEIVYKDALEFEFKKAGIPYERE